MRFFRGFTLVELMLVVAFIGIMAGVVLVSFSTRSTSESVKSAAREVAAAVRETQVSALSGFGRGESESIPDGSRICRYEINQISSTQYRSIVFYSSSNCLSGTEENITLLTYTLPNGVSFPSGSPSSPVWSIKFAVPRGEIMTGSSSSISLVKGESSFSVCVSPAGSVKESVSCP